jgi:hypothetical protein
MGAIDIEKRVYVKVQNIYPVNQRSLLAGSVTLSVHSEVNRPDYHQKNNNFLGE